MKAPEEELKRLLLASELDLLERVRARCDALQARVGDDPALKNSVRAVIIDVLRESGVHDHNRLARVMAPLVVASMREEIRNSRDMMVDALYPITGRLVAAAVRNAFNELIEKLNRRLDEGFSFEVWRAKLQAKITGRSEAEFLLQRNPPFEIEEMFVIHRPTGLLIEWLTADGHAEHGADSELVSGMLTAIMAFVREAFQDEEGGELRTLAFGESHLFLQTSPSVVLAVKTTGSAPSNFDAALQDIFFAILEHWGDYLTAFDGAAAQDEKLSFADDIRDRFRQLLSDGKSNFRGRSRKAYLVIALLLILIALWPAYLFYQSYQAGKIEDRARRVVTADTALVGYPITVRYDTSAKALVVDGLLPSAEMREKLGAELDRQLPDVAKELHLGSLRQATGNEVNQNTLASLNERLSRLKVDLTQAITSIESKAQSSTKTLSEDFRKSLAELESTLTERQTLTKEDLAEAIGRIESAWQKVERRVAAMREITPEEKLRDWVASHAIFMSDEVSFRDPEQVDRQLRELAALMKETPADLRIRVVGYTDNTGTTRSNQALSIERARSAIDKLVGLGVPADRLIAVGRSSEKPISDSDRERMANNRRIEFEIAFVGE